MKNSKKKFHQVAVKILDFIITSLWRHPCTAATILKSRKREPHRNGKSRHVCRFSWPISLTSFW